MWSKKELERQRGEREKERARERGRERKTQKLEGNLLRIRVSSEDKREQESW